MRILDSGKLNARLVARCSVITRRAFGDVPSIIHTCSRRRPDIDLLDLILANVGDVQQSSRWIERIAPRIPQAVCPYLLAHIGLANEWIRRGNGIRIAIVDVDSKNLSEKGILVLCVSVGISTATAIA